MRRVKHPVVSRYRALELAMSLIKEHADDCRIKDNAVNFCHREILRLKALVNN